MVYNPGIFRSYIDHHFTYIAGFDRNVARYHDRPALIDPATGEQWTYAQLGQRVDRLAAALHAAGVGRGDRVLYQLFNGPEFVLVYLATQRLGAIDVPINHRLSVGETAYILQDSTPLVYLYDERLAATAEHALARWGGRPALVAVGTRTPDTHGRLGQTVGFEQFVSGAADLAVPALPADFSTYEETTRLYTSGTTGMPKGVALPSLVEVMSAHDVMMHFPLGPYDRTLNMTPWFHRGGLYSGGPNPVYYAGGSVVPMPDFDPALALDWVDEYDITFLIGAPATLEAIANEQEARPRPLRTLKGIVTMGAPLDRAAALRYQRLLTPRIFNGYGTTETFWNTFLRPEDLPEHAGTAGRASTDDDVAVVRIYEDHRAEPDELVARDNTESGEVIMRSPKSGFAYVNLPGVQEEKFHSGWLYTGDIAVWDADGFLTILGRKDDMIISGGENVHPVQVEEALARNRGVADSAVVGIPDPTWGQKIVAFVVRAPAGAPGVPAQPVTAEDLDAMLLSDDNLADFKRPRGYRFVDSLPMTATGKKVHYEVARLATEAAASGDIELLGFRKK
ncbi:class I adenylate-forming enzyme family protein [Brevibacterium moorei]|uniref:class I adenylate-forming enzyme family protein n=1 Tax=Brevibacterium moorei TaxID=2968457 RepID=UPI00211B7F5E|nr:AMP-binding protein [Brevibacterium sp. 68QC2CO]MCQ9385600.1 AMP-binding protein [Brevibacterium sp. 68QC2CO]